MILLGVESLEFIVDVLKYCCVLFGILDGGVYVKYWLGGQFLIDVIIWLLCDEGLFFFEEMYYKLSYLFVCFVGLSGWGVFFEGFVVDVMVYDFVNFFCNFDKYDVVFDLFDGGYWCINKVKGVDVVIVNGQKIYGLNMECIDVLLGDVFCLEFLGV